MNSIKRRIETLEDRTDNKADVIPRLRTIHSSLTRVYGAGNDVEASDEQLIAWYNPQAIQAAINKAYGTA